MMNYIYILFSFLLISCDSERITESVKNNYCIDLSSQEACFIIDYESEKDFEQDEFWTNFMDTLLKFKGSKKNFGLISTKKYRGITEKKFVAVGTDYFIYGKKEIGPILVVTSNRFNNVHSLTESSALSSTQIDSLRKVCENIYQNEGGILKEKF